MGLAEGAQRGLGLAVEDKLAVGIVLDEQHVVALGDRDDLLATRVGEAGARRVLEARDDVDELGAHRRGRKHVLERLGDHALVIRFDHQVLGLVGVEGLEGAEVGGALHDHQIARIEQDLRHQVQGLLRPRGHQDLLAAGGEGKGRGDEGAQGLDPFGRRVLQGGGAVLAERRFAALLHGLEGEELGGGQAACERDDVRLLGQLEDLTDRRALHPGRASGEPRRRIGLEGPHHWRSFLGRRPRGSRCADQASVYHAPRKLIRPISILCRNEILGVS
ncbi:hypothetical protein D3C86_1037460 [compost metagenome]